MYAKTLADQVAVTRISDNEYHSTFHPNKMGNIDRKNSKPIAYGGCTFGIGVNAAYQTVDAKYHAYSVFGNYLGPTLIDRKLHCTVSRVRDTRTFATRTVLLSQTQDDGSERSCAFLLVDFQVREPASMLEYASPPRHAWPQVDACPTSLEAGQALLQQGKVTDALLRAWRSAFALNEAFFETRAPPESILSQTLSSIVGGMATTQGELPLQERASAMWTKARHALPSEGHQLGALAFFMDGALSFLPLAHSGLSLGDAGACSSLDFGLRIMSCDVDLGKWHLKELATVAGEGGRTYSEARLWDEGGKVVAVMTQMNILRPKKAAL